MITPLLERIREAQVEAMKVEHHKSERIMGKLSSFDYDSKGILTLHRVVWVSYYGGA